MEDSELWVKQHLEKETAGAGVAELRALKDEAQGPGRPERLEEQKESKRRSMKMLK